MRRITKKRRQDPAADSAIMQRYIDKVKYMSSVAPTLVNCPDHRPFHAQFGAFQPDSRYSLDQVGIEFDYSAKRGTLAHTDERRSGCIWARCGKSGWEKRWATIQMICSADLKEAQPRIACIFKGKGKISEAERLSFADDVDIYWTPSGWIDKQSCHQWIRKTWKAHADVRLARRMGAALIIADNHTSQACASTRRPFREHGAELMCRLSFMSKKFA